MKRELEPISEANTLSDDVSRSRRDFFKSVGKYSLAVAGAMMLADMHVSSRVAEAAEPVGGKMMAPSRMKFEQQPAGAGKQRMKARQRLDPKMKGSLGSKYKVPRLPDCW